MKQYDRYFNIRMSQADWALLNEIKRVYGLPSWAAAGRMCIRSVAQARGLAPRGEVRDGTR